MTPIDQIVNICKEANINQEGRLISDAESEFYGHITKNRKYIFSKTISLKLGSISEFELLPRMFEIFDCGKRRQIDIIIGPEFDVDDEFYNCIWNNTSFMGLLNFEKFEILKF